MKTNMSFLLKILMISAIIILIIFTNLPTYAISMGNSTRITTGFYETNNSYSFYETNNSFNLFNNMTSKIFIVILSAYLIFQVITIYKNKPKQQIVYHNLIVLLILSIMYIITSVFIVDMDLLSLMKEAIFIVYSLILVVSLIIQIVCLLKQKTTKNLNRKLIIISIINIVIIVIYILIPKVQITTREWAFGRTLGLDQYERIMLKNKNYLGFKIIDIDKDGVLVEYDLINYSYDSEKHQYITEEETIQEKLKWNKTYGYDRYAKVPMLSVDGGTVYYIKFKR